jgi:hypothetical protein
MGMSITQLENDFLRSEIKRLKSLRTDDIESLQTIIFNQLTHLLDIDDMGELENCRSAANDIVSTWIHSAKIKLN